MYFAMYETAKDDVGKQNGLRIVFLKAKRTFPEMGNLKGAKK